MPRNREKRRAILLGIDGVTFDLLLPWSRNGIMPNLSKALEMGTYGELESTFPPITPPAWTSCVTGVGPGKHGIFDFRESHTLDPLRPPVSSLSVRVPRIWHFLNAAGRKTGVMNVPVTYPPEEVDGFMISGMMTPSHDCVYTYPTGLKDELHMACGDYLIEIDIPRYDVGNVDDSELFFRDMTYCFEKRKDAFFYLMDTKAWDFFMVVFTMTDRIQHLFWKYLFPGSDHHDQQHAAFFREKIFTCYSLLDDMLGAVLSRLDDSTDLFLVSDHGFGYTEQWFNVDRWLEDTDVTKDWPGTRIFFSGIPTQGIHIDPRREHQRGTHYLHADHDQLRDRLREELLNLKDPMTGREFIDRILYREDVFEGPYMELAPDLLFVAKDYSVLGRQGLESDSWLETSENQANGFHRSNGIFLSLGRDIMKNNTIRGACITDIMPTVLHAMGEPVPEGLDGRVLDSIFNRDLFESTGGRQEEVVPTRRIPEVQCLGTPGGIVSGLSAYTPEEATVVWERLRGLDYIE